MVRDSLIQQTKALCDPCPTDVCLPLTVMTLTVDSIANIWFLESIHIRPMRIQIKWKSTLGWYIHGAVTLKVASFG